MILRLVLCFCFSCFVDCDSWIQTNTNSPQEITTGDNITLSETNCTNAKNLSDASSQCNETTVLEEPKLPNEDATLVLTPLEQEENDFQNENLLASNAARDTATEDGRRTLNIPQMFVNGYPQTWNDVNSEECFSSQNVKIIVKKVLEHVKEHPYALDLIINDIQSEIENEPHVFKSGDDQNNGVIISFLKALQPVSNDDACPASIVKLVEQIPKFLSQLRRNPQCLSLMYGCNKDCEESSILSNVCATLPSLLNICEAYTSNPDPKPEFESQELYIDNKPTPELSFEIINSDVKIPSYKSEFGEIKSELESDNIQPQYAPQTLSEDTLLQTNPDIKFGPNLEFLNQEQILPIYIDKGLSYPIRAQETKDIHVPEAESIYPKSIYIKKSEPIYTEISGPIYIENPETINVQQRESVSVKDSKPVVESIYIEKPKQIYIEDTKPVYLEEPKPMSVEEPKLTYVQEPEPIYVEEIKPVVEPIYIQKPDRVYVDGPKPVLEPIYDQELKPIYIEESKPVFEPAYNEEPKPIYIEQSKPVSEPVYNQELKPIYIEQSKVIEPEPIYVEHSKLIAVEEPKLLKSLLKPLYLEAAEPTYIESELEPLNESQTVSVEELSPDYENANRPANTVNLELENINTKPKPIEFEKPEHIYINEPESLFVEEPNIYIEKHKPIYIQKSEIDYIEKPEPIATDELGPTPSYLDTELTQSIYAEESDSTLPKIRKPIHIEEYIREPSKKSQLSYIEESTPAYETEFSSALADLKPGYIKEKPKSVIIKAQKPVYIDGPEYVYMEEPESVLDEEPQIYIDKTKPYHAQESETFYFDEPKANFYDESIYAEKQTLVKESNPIHIFVEKDKPIYFKEPETTYIDKPSSEPIHIAYIPKELTTHQINIPTKIIAEILQLIKDNPKKHINNIIKVLKQNQQVIDPQLYKILFSVLNALIEGKVDSKRFIEIFYYLIQPHINNKLNIQKTQTIYHLLLQGNTGQVDTSILDVIHRLIQQPENNSNNQERFDLILPLLKKFKTEHVDQRIIDIILLLLNLNENSKFSMKQIEILLSFLKPKKKGEIPQKYIDIASMLVNFDKISDLSPSNMNTIFLLMKPNKTGKIDAKAIEILHEILLPKKGLLLTEDNIIDILTFLGTDSGENVQTKRVDIVFFLLKNRPRAPVLIDYLIKNLKKHDFVHSKFVDIILYLRKRKMLNFNILETLVSLLPQETSGNIDKKLINNLFLLLEPYRITHPKVLIDVYNILNVEKVPTQNVDMNKIPDNLKHRMNYLMNSDGSQFDQYLYPEYSEQEDQDIFKRNLLSKVLQRLEWEQNREIVPELLGHNSGYVELTYMLKNQKPLLYRPVYYVKYKIPMEKFLKNVQGLIEANPKLITDPTKLLHELIVTGSVSEVSPDLKDVHNEDVIKLTFEGDNIIQAKVLDENRFNLNDQIKLVQDFNSDVTSQEILQQNKINAAKYYTTYEGRRQRPNLAGIGSVVNKGIVDSTVEPLIIKVKGSNLQNVQAINQSKLPNYNIPFLYKRSKSSSPILAGLGDINKRNDTIRHQKSEN